MTVRFGFKLFNKEASILCFNAQSDIGSDSGQIISLE